MTEYTLSSLKRLFWLGMVVLFCQPATAGLAGQTLGGCPERIYLSEAQLHVTAAMATVGDPIENHFSTRDRDTTTFDVMIGCARKLPYHVCSDELLMGILDPTSAAYAGAAGLFLDARNGRPSVIGGLVGAGVVGMASGTVKIAQCNQGLEAIKPAAITAFGRWMINTNNVQKSEVRDRVVKAARNRLITAEDAEKLLKFIDGVATRLAAP